MRDLHRRILLVLALLAAAAAPTTAMAGGILLYEVGSADVGLASAGTFGMALAYDQGWVGRYYAQEATLIGLSVLPSIAWRVHEKLSLGASLSAMYGVLGQKVAINSITGPDGQLALADTAWGFGANLGLLWEPGPGTRLGLTYNSQVNLDFGARPAFTGLTPALELLLRARGLDTATIDLGIKVPQGVMVSAFHQLNDRWALLGSAGWQQWSRFGLLEAGISDTSNPTSVTKDLGFKDTWHLAAGAQFQASPAWRIDAGVVYDSGFQDSSNVSPMLPADAAWRFGAGVRNQSSDRFGWGVAAEYAYGGTLGVDRQGTTPVLGGRGNLSGAYADTGIFFLAVHGDWRL